MKEHDSFKLTVFPQHRIDEEKIEKRLQNFRKNLIEKSEKEAQIKEHKLGVQDRRS